MSVAIFVEVGDRIKETRHVSSGGHFHATLVSVEAFLKRGDGVIVVFRR